MAHDDIIASSGYSHVSCVLTICFDRLGDDLGSITNETGHDFLMGTGFIPADVSGGTMDPPLKTVGDDALKARQILEGISKEYCRMRLRPWDLIQ